MIRHIQSPGIISILFKHFEEYLGILRNIDTYSAKHTGAQLGEREKTAPALFKNRKKYPDFVEKSS